MATEPLCLPSSNREFVQTAPLRCGEKYAYIARWPLIETTPAARSGYRAPLAIA
jgi:hypothetical protein